MRDKNICFHTGVAHLPSLLATVAEHGKGEVVDPFRLLPLIVHDIIDVAKFSALLLRPDVIEEEVGAFALFFHLREQP